MKSLNIPPQERVILFQFKKSLKKSLGDNLVSIQLFGSKARGDYGKDSDIDILLVIKKRDYRIEELIYNTVVDLMLKNGLYLSVKIFGSEEFEKLNKIPTVFMQKVRQEAIKL